MKTVAHSPAAPLTQLLVHILPGGMQVVASKRSAHPLVANDAVAHAWDPQPFASASRISDLLRAAAATTVAALQAALHDLLAPDRRRIRREVSPGCLVVDLALTALVVSDQAHPYKEPISGISENKTGRPVATRSPAPNSPGARMCCCWGTFCTRGGPSPASARANWWR